MNQFKMLKPEEAARRAKENVAAFKKEQERMAAKAKRKPAESPAAKPAPAVEPVNEAPGGIKSKHWLSVLLLNSAEKGDHKEVERLLKAGADVDARRKIEGWTALIFAALNGHKEVARVLIANKAEVDAKCSELGRTALFYASSGARGFSEGHFEIVKMLIENGADVNAKDKGGQSVLQMSDSEKAKEFLKAQGAKE